MQKTKDYAVSHVCGNARNCSIMAKRMEQNFGNKNLKCFCQRCDLPPHHNYSYIIYIRYAFHRKKKNAKMNIGFDILYYGLYGFSELGKIFN